MKYNLKNPLSFNQYSWDDYLPKLKLLASHSLQTIEEIKKKPASFENTILKLEECTRDFNQLMGIFLNLVSVNKDLNLSDRIDEISEEINKLSSELSSQIMFDEDLFKKVNEVYLEREKLNDLDKKLTEETFKGFEENGIHLNQELKEELKNIDIEMGEIGIKIDSNLLKEMSLMSITASKEEVEGLPEDILALAKALASERKVNGYVLNVDDSSYSCVLEYAKNPNLREKMFKLFRSVGMNDNEFNNYKLIQRLLVLRQRQAEILGYNKFHEMILKDRMAKNIANVEKILNNLEDKVRPLAQKEYEELNKMAKADKVVLTKAHEFYYDRLVKESKYNLDLNQLRNFFPLPTVWAGFKKLMKTMYDIDFNRINIPTYHRSVETYEICRNNETLGVIYLDWFSRPEKQSGAWMNPVINPYKDQIPFVFVVNNFTPPSENSPCLLSFGDVKTLFHEMGHALHVILSKVPYESLSGINVAWDFVELPSQIMENFVCEPEVLKLISSHYKTSEVLNQEQVDKIISLNQSNLSLGILSHIGLSKLDLELHKADPYNLNFKELEEFYKKYCICPLIDGTGRLGHFSHILSGGYAVGYYSYLWAEILDADCYSKFKSQGILNAQVAHLFEKEILSVGGSRDEDESFRKFMNRDPDISAYLKRSGLFL